MDVERDLDVSAASWPPEDRPVFREVDDESDAWEQVSGNRRYDDGFRDFGRQDLLTAVQIDQSWLDGHPNDWADDTEDEFYDRYEDEVGPGPSMLDPETAAAVIAIAAAGGVPVSSCNGQPGHQYPYPTVAFWTQRPRLHLIESAAAEADCGLMNGLDGCVILCAPDIIRLVRFARAVEARLTAL